MESTPTEEPPNSNEEWFNQESSMILSEQLEKVNNQSKIVKVQEGKNDNQNEEQEKTEMLPSTNIEPSDEDNAKDTNNIDNESQVKSKIDFSPDELECESDKMNENVPSGCEMTSPDFNDDQDVEIINAFKQGSQLIFLLFDKFFFIL